MFVPNLEGRITKSSEVHCLPPFIEYVMSVALIPSLGIICSHLL